MASKQNWRHYWSGIDDPGRRHTDEADVKLYSQELALHFPERIDRCLELGCGDGSLFRYFRSCFGDYVGIDFSPAMLRRFRNELGPVSLVCADASRVPLANTTYDFVFSVGLMQYFDPDQIRRNLQEVRELLDDRGVYLIANIPDAQLRLHYYARALRSQEATSILGGLRMSFRVFLGRRFDGLGYWYSRRFLFELAREQGFECRTYSSPMYEYRFHAVLKKTS